MRCRRVPNPFPEGAIPVGIGLLVAGVTAYGFLVIAARALGPERYASLSVLWALVFLAGPGFFSPLEQELGRALAARQAVGLGGGPFLKQAALAGGGLAGALVGVSVLEGRFLLVHLFDSDLLLLYAFLASLIAYFVQHMVRGTMAGMGRFGDYSVLVGAEGVVRLGGCAMLAGLGVVTAGPYGLVLGCAPLVASTLFLRVRRRALAPGPSSKWEDVCRPLGYLLAASILAQFLANAGPVAVKLLAPSADRRSAGLFLAGLVVARVPLFFFVAVQAALLPSLSGLAARGRRADFRLVLRRVLTAVAVVGIAATIGAFAVGPTIVRLLFGASFDLARSDLAYLAAGSAAYMLALALVQGLLALQSHARIALGWLVGVSVFVVVTALGTGLQARVEHGYLWGSLAASVAMGALLFPRLAAAESQESGVAPAAREAL